MDDSLCLLVTVYYQEFGSLLECALKVKRDKLPPSFDENPYRHECLVELTGLLPLHVRSAGPICKVEQIFEVHEVN